MAIQEKGASSSGSGASSLLTAYEPIQRSRTDSSSRGSPFESDDGVVKPISRLPPKPLPGRRRWLDFTIASVSATVSIIVLSILISRIPSFLPSTGYYGLEFANDISCDLVNKQNSSRWESAFQINLRGGAKLSFAQAKFIDLLFDLIVGQGGRLLMATIAYLVFMDALLRSMEKSPVSYRLYASMVFSSTSIISTWHSAKGVFTTKGWRAKMYLVWSALAMAYILVFPTLIESATGYVNPSSSGFSVSNGSFVMSDSNDLLSCLNVTGGALIGMDNGTFVNGPAAHVFDAVQGNYISSQTYGEIMKYNTSVFSALIFWKEDTIYNARNTSEPPYRAQSANRSGIYEVPSHDYSWHTNITINGIMYILNNTSPYDLWEAAYCYGDNHINPNELLQSPFCFAKSYFVWGFSSIVLYVVLSMQLVWTIGMYLVWLDANLVSDLVKSGRTIRGPFRAASDLAEATREQLGDDTCVYSDEEIVKELEKRGDGLRYYGSLPDDYGVLHIGMTSRPVPKFLLSRRRLYGAGGSVVGRHATSSTERLVFPTSPSAVQECG